MSPVQTVRSVMPQLLQAGLDVIIMSIGALGDASLCESLAAAAGVGRARLMTMPGAIGGLDALVAVTASGVSNNEDWQS